MSAVIERGSDLQLYGDDVATSERFRVQVSLDLFAGCVADPHVFAADTHVK